MRSVAASGWSPNSWAIRPTQLRAPYRRTVRLTARATTSPVGASDRWSPDMNSAANRASVTLNLVMAILRAPS